MDLMTFFLAILLVYTDFINPNWQIKAGRRAEQSLDRLM